MKRRCVCFCLPI